MNNFKSFTKAEDTRNFLNYIPRVHIKSCHFKDVIKYIAQLQCPDGSFSLLKGSLPNDVYVYMNMEPTFICTSMFIKAYLANPNWFEKNIGVRALKKALRRCNKTYFWGHGYEGLEIQLKTMKMFLKNGLNAFLKSYYWIDRDFTAMIRSIMNDYYERCRIRNYNFCFGNYKAEVKEVIKLYEQ